MPPDPNLLKVILEPLLEDFQHWLGRAESLLLEEEVAFLSAESHADLLARVTQARQEVGATQSLFIAMGGQVGVDPAVVRIWHELVSECWQVMIRHRLGEASQPETH